MLPVSIRGLERLDLLNGRTEVAQSGYVPDSGSIQQRHVPSRASEQDCMLDANQVNVLPEESLSQPLVGDIENRPHTCALGQQMTNGFHVGGQAFVAVLISAAL
jgi:hypothetical protein